MRILTTIRVITILVFLSLVLQFTTNQHVLAAPAVQGIITATPQPDGSIVHTVQAGESLISIAEAYQVSVNEIKAQNGLTGDDIFLGDTLIIRAAPTPGPTNTPTTTATATREPTSTKRPTRTPTTTTQPTSTGQANTTPEATASDREPLQPDQVGNILLGAIITLGVVGAGLMIAGSLMGRRAKGGGS